MPIRFGVRPKSVARRVHDAYTRALSIFRIPLRKQRFSEASGVDDLGEVQAAGESLLDNGLESAFYGSEQRFVRRTWPGGHLYRVRNAAVVGDNGHIFLSDGTLLTTASNEYSEPDRKIRRPIRLGAARMDGPLFHLTGVAHGNRAHFVLQLLLGLLAAKPSLEQRPEMRVLVANKHRSWQFGYLDRLGIHPERVIENSAGTVLASELYYVPPLFGPDQLGVPSAYEQLRAAWPEGSRPEPKSVLFVSRRDAPGRRLLNEEEIVRTTCEVLGPVDCVALAGLPLDEQVTRFQSARWIIGPHGQGLSNAVFSPRSLLVDLSAGVTLPGEAQWVTTYRNMTLMQRGRAVRLVSGLPNLGNADWHFPAERYRDQLKKLARLCQQ